MNISELITKLEALRAEHGDLETAAWDFGCGCCGGIELPDPIVYELDQYETLGYSARHLDKTPGRKIVRLN